MASEETVRRLKALYERIAPLRARLEQVHAEIGLLMNSPQSLPGSPYGRARALVAEVEAIQEEIRISFDEISGRIDRVNAEG